jgi:hypothetical protein
LKLIAEFGNFVITFIYKVGGELSAGGMNRAPQAQVGEPERVVSPLSGRIHSLFNVREVFRLKYETSSYL